MSQVLSPLDRYAPKPPPLPLPSHPMVEEVMSGCRFVTHPYVVSLLIISLNRTLGGIQVIGRGPWPLGNLFGATLISLIFGWWGFPWGILWTPIALYHLWRGGRDCTEAFLIEAVGHADARRVLAAAPKPKAPPAIWIVRLLILVPVLAFGFLFTAIASA